MPDDLVRLTPLRVPLQDLMLDPNNPRFAKSMNLPEPVPDAQVAAAQERVRDLFVNTDRASESSPEEEDTDVPEGAVEIGDLVSKIEQIGFVPIDRVVVRPLIKIKSKQRYLVIEGNRRVATAKLLFDKPPPTDPDKKRHHEWVVGTLRELDVLLLETAGLTEDALHHQIGVILGLRHFNSILDWGPLAKAANIYNEYMSSAPRLDAFALSTQRIGSIVTRLSVSRGNVLNSLRTYIAYRQLQGAFPEGPPQPKHYSLTQACVTNRKLRTARFIEQDDNTLELTAASLDRINAVCEFKTRDDAKRADDPPNILAEDKSVSAFAALVQDATSNPDQAVQAFAASLRDEVLSKDRPLLDAVDNLRTFKSDRAWTDALAALLDKIEDPDGPPDPQGRRLTLRAFHPMGSELAKLEEARQAFRNVRKILDV